MLRHVSELSFATAVAIDFYLYTVVFSLQVALEYVLIFSDVSCDYLKVVFFWLFL